MADPDRRWGDSSEVLTVSSPAKPSVIILVLLAGLLGLTGLVGCAVAVAPPAAFPVSCPGSGTGPSTPAGTQTVPARVVHTRTGATLVLVPVCLSGQGPFPFVLDTGAAQSLVDRSLADRLQLPPTGTTASATGVGCTVPAGHVQVADWSVGTVPLRAQPVTSLPMAGAPGGPGIAGLLGSDVWSRFGRFQLDYRAGQVLLPGPEQATAPTADPAVPPPSAPAGRRVPMTVVHSQTGGTLALVPVSLDGLEPKKFVLDTGSSSSVVDRGVAQQLSLPPVGKTHQASGVSCAATSQPVHVASWQVGAVPLFAQNVESIALPIPGLEGLVGSDVLYRFGTVTVDYAAGQLVLGG
ncbi:MAG: pepsin/retropepsin-like aspartic protease family protein [Pseudonocardiaceae bacterium]